MNWVSSLTQAIDYMEEHLIEEIKMEDIAKEACISTAYFQRIFMVLTGMSVFEYIRKRRLSQAGTALCKTSQKVIDIALEFGYESAESFTRAFKKCHGITPSEARKGGNLQVFPRLQIQIILKGVESMKYRIEKKEAFGFYGLEKSFSTLDGANFRDIPAFWNSVMQDGSYKEMIEKASTPSCLGICMPMKNDQETEFDYIIGAFTDKEVKGYTYHQVPAVEWAVFEARGPLPDVLQDVWKRIFSEWFPATGYKHLDLPELEVYYEGDITSEDYLTEVWIPIKK